MINLNKELYRLIKKGGITPNTLYLALTSPHYYSATSVKDFLDEKDDLKGTPLLSVAGLGAFYGSNIILLSNVWTEEQDGISRIWDLTGELKASLINLTGDKDKPEYHSFPDGRYSDVIINYNSHSKTTTLYDASNNIIGKDRNKSSKTIADLVLSPS